MGSDEALSAGGFPVGVIGGGAGVLGGCVLASLLSWVGIPMLLLQGHGRMVGFDPDHPGIL